MKKRQPLATWEMAEIIAREDRAPIAVREAMRGHLVNTDNGLRKCGWAASLRVMRLWDQHYPEDPVQPPYEGQGETMMLTDTEAAKLMKLGKGMTAEERNALSEYLKMTGLRQRSQPFPTEGAASEI